MSNDDVDAASGGKAESSDDRRRFPRLAKECTIRVRPLSGLEEASEGIEAVTVNISGGGLCYAAEEPVATGAFVAVEMQMSDLDSPVLALARTAFCASDGPPYDIGLEFWWVGWGDDSAQRAIADMIKMELRQRGQA